MTIKELVNALSRIEDQDQEINLSVFPGLYYNIKDVVQFGGTDINTSYHIVAHKAPKTEA